MSGKDLVKWKLQVIFIYYSSYADRNNFKLLKQQNYRRFLIDSQTVRSQSAFVHFDIAFQKINHSSIIFKDFLKLIPEIAELVFKQSNRANAFKQYIQKHIQPLFTEIIAKSQFGQDINTAFHTIIDEKIQRKLLKITVTEKSFYQYIGSSLNNKDIYHIFECLACFLKDFQVSPQIVPKSVVYTIFLFLMKDKNLNETFTLEDFVKCLILISEVASRKISIGQLSNNLKMIKLLQRMQISIGFDKVSKKILYQTAISSSYLKSFNDLLRQQEEYLLKQERNANKLIGGGRHRTCESVQFNSSGSRKERKQELKNSNFNTVENIIKEENSQNLSKEFRQIKLAFQQLCQFGQVANSKTLKSMKIKKLFERVGLVPIVSQAWLDIQIVNLQRSSQSGKIQFPQFLELLSLVSKKIGSDFDEILLLILTDKQINQRAAMESGVSNKRKQYSEEDEKLLKQIVQVCQKQADKIFRKYAVDSPLLGFTQFSKMMYDFDIFPTIISKSKLYQIFSTLNDVREETSPTSLSKKNSKVKQVESYLKENKKIDFSGFLLGLIEVGQQICDQNLEVAQKLIILLQKINESTGYKKITNVSLVQNLRKKFSKLYMKNFQKPIEHVQDFDELLQSYP